jgi:membrane-bound lytic murein transglycosylase B
MKFIFIFIIIFTFSNAKSEDFTKKQEVKEFINTFSKNSNYTKGELIKLFSKVDIQNFSLEYYSKELKKDFEIKGDFIGSWDKYEKKIINKKRIEDGVKYIKENRKYFIKAQKIYNIPSTYIASIIGVESLYGANTGKQNVFDVLATLAFKENRRNKFFKKELEEYLLVAKKNKIDLSKQKGSFAGAIGLTQFMPTNIKAYAVDFDKNGKIDLNSSADAIGSVANFLKKHGWNSHIPVATRVSYIGTRFSKYETGLKHKYNRIDLKGIKPKSEKFFYKNEVYLLKLSRKDYDELWYATKNFKVLTNYNRSVYYAMSIYQLAKEIRKEYLNSK